MPKPSTTASEAKAFTTPGGTYFSFDIMVTGGVALEWDNAAQAGNIFGFSLGIDWYHFRVAIGVAGVLPASNVEGAVESVWIEGWWYALGGFGNVTPYIVLGAGVVTADAIESLIWKDDCAGSQATAMWWQRR